ncbi:MAG: acyl-CoA dehydrogenase family protein [Acidimicrobiales bacterium]
MIDDRYAIGEGWVRPTLIAGATEEQQARWLPGIDDRSALWCQLFSEPEAGSDLASLRTVAVRDGDTYVVDGAKVWSTWADRADWGILLARTDPTVAKHKGISYFALDMRTPGVEVRPLIEMTGGSHFNEVFLTGVRVAADCRIGGEGEGWRLATVTLANERASLSEGGVLWGMGPTSEDLFCELRALGGVPDPVLRQRAARVYTEMLVLRVLAARRDGPASSIRKALADEHGQHVTSLMHDVRGAAGMLGAASESLRDEDVWAWGYLFSRALTIGGGTSEVQRNVIGERVLGLPREPAA